MGRYSKNTMPMLPMTKCSAANISGGWEEAGRVFMYMVKHKRYVIKEENFK